MDGDHVSKLCCIFHYNRFLVYFLTYFSSSVGDYKCLGQSTLPSHHSNYLLYCVFYSEKNIMQNRKKQRCAKWSGLSIIQSKHFLTLLSLLINFTTFTRKAQWAFEVCMLLDLFFKVTNHIWDGCRRKQCLRASLSTVLYMTLHHSCLLICLAKKIWVYSL